MVKKSTLSLVVISLCLMTNTGLGQNTSSSELDQKSLKNWFMKDFKIKLPDNLIKEWVDLVTNNSILVEPKARFDIIKEDLSDNKFLDCAHEGKVNYIISNDKHLLKLKEFKGIKIVKPKDFMNTI